MELNANLSPLFTENVIKLLNKHNIVTVIDFVKEDSFKLSQLTNFELERVNELKNGVLSRFRAINTGLDNESHLIKTGIDKFDDLLGGGLTSGGLYDICGLSAAGKTQICNSIAVNLAINYNYETLYIDAKNDFSGHRIFNILNARNCSDDDCSVIMERIRSQSIYDVHEFLTILRELPAYLEENKQVKCLVIDSLPALWFPLLDSKKNGVSLLCEATNLMQKIAFVHNMIILLVNIVTRRTETDLDPSEHYKTKTTVALGKYWQTIPRQRFLMSRIDVTNSQNTSQRTIKIIQRKGKGKTCIVNITNKGVV